MQRHIKSSHANSTPATDGDRVIAFFGSEGLNSYSMDGELLWKKDLGYLDAGAFDVPEIQWGFGSSPVLHDGTVYVLCDVNNQSFIAALDAATGDELWRTLRDEIPTWGSPTVAEVNGRTQLIVNGYQHIGAYDATTGEEIWRMRGGGDVPVPTPVVAHGLVFITNAHGRMHPIYAIRLEAEGDISLGDRETSNAFVAWSDPRGGTYMPTPLVLGEHLYILANTGVLTCFEAVTGKKLYRERVGDRRRAFTASPVAAAGRLYLVSEHGEVSVIKAGSEPEQLASNDMGGLCLASPAIAGDTLLVRTSKHLVALRDGAQSQPAVDERAVEAGPRIDPRYAEPPAEELSDAVEVLRYLDAACKAVRAVQYTAAMQASTGGRVEGSVLADSSTGDLLYRIEAAYTPADAETVRFTASFDGNRYYFADHDSRTLRSDFDSMAFGPYQSAVLSVLVNEFHLDEPFDSEINGKEHELLPPRELDGEECYAVRVVYRDERFSQSTWVVSKRDLLPRGRYSLYEADAGSRMRIDMTLTDLVVDPPHDSDVFTLKLPEGYTLVDQPSE